MINKTMAEDRKAVDRWENEGGKIDETLNPSYAKDCAGRIRKRSNKKFSGVS
jgi:hypothetical protein